MSIDNERFPLNAEEATEKMLDRNGIAVLPHQAQQIRTGARVYGFLDQQNAFPSEPANILTEVEKTTEFIKGDVSLRGDFQTGFDSGKEQEQLHPRKI